MQPLPTPSARDGTVIILVLALAAALMLVCTMFLSEVMGQRTSGRNYLRASSARYSAIAGREHALSVLAEQFKAEITAGATTLESPYRSAFLPPDDLSGEVPGAPGSALLMEPPIWTDVLGYSARGGDLTDIDGDGVLDWALDRSDHVRRWGAVGILEDPSRPWDSANRPYFYTRFIDHQTFDRDFKPTTDPSKIVYRTRYDVLILNIDSQISIRPDLGADEYRDPASAQVFVDGVSSDMLPFDDLADNYRHLYARSLGSIHAAHPAGFYDGERGDKVYESYTTVGGRHVGDGEVYLVQTPGMRSGGGWAHCHFPIGFRYRGYTDDNERYDYNNGESARHLCDMFHGVGLGRSANAQANLFNPAPNAGVMHQPTARPVTTDHFQVRGPAVLATPGERPFSPKMVWSQYRLHDAGDNKMHAESYVPFGSGIVDPTMDHGGVPWEINPLTAPERALSHLVLGLSPQLLAGEDAVAGADQSFDNAGVFDRFEGKTYRVNANVDVDVSGYQFGRRTRFGTHQLEVLDHPRMPTAADNDHDHPSAILTRFGNDTYALAAVHPFYDPALGNDPETDVQLYHHLDGLDAGGSPVADQAEARFLNRLRYSRWVNWKHEFSSSSPIVEQRLAELDSPITYREGIRYYRRPSARSLRYDVGTTAERRHFDRHVDQAGITDAAGAIPGATFIWTHPSRPPPSGSDDDGNGVIDPDERGFSQPAASKADGALRYRYFPHTYPGPMWTGREGRWNQTDALGNPAAEHAHIKWDRNNPTIATDAGRALRGRRGRNGRGTNDIFNYDIDPNSGDTWPISGRVDAVDSFFWDVAIATFAAIAEARDQAETAYPSAVGVSAQSIDERMIEILGLGPTNFPSGAYAAGENVVVTGLYNPAEPVDTDGVAGYDPTSDTVSVTADFDGDGSEETLDVPAVRDPDYVYRQYNQFWPVPDRRVPHRLLDPASGNTWATLQEARDAVNGVTAPSYTWRLGSDRQELTTEFVDDDWYYDHSRAQVLASMVLNDIRMSLLGTGAPQTLDEFRDDTVALASADGVAGMQRMDDAGAVYLAGRKDGRSTPTPDLRPFSRTGRLVVKRDRYYRVVVRAQLINDTLPASRYDEDLTEVFMDAWICIDPDRQHASGSDPVDIRILHQRFSTSPFRTKAR